MSSQVGGESGSESTRLSRLLDEGPAPEGPGQPTHRLTTEPIAEPKFIDRDAGLEPRRYWIVAVDALGQEGIPSSPTWHYRTQRDFYVPFVGDWHQ